MAQALLEEGLVKLGLGTDDRVLPLLERYIEEIELFNPAYGLVKVRDRDELIVKHILDSLSPLNIIRNLLESSGGPKNKNIADVGSGAGLQGKPGAWQIADVGSGAGLPGIPLAVCLPEAAFTLIERMGRRAGFLRDAVAVLGLSKVRVEETDMEKFMLQPEELFDVIVFRAFKPLDSAILKKLFSLLAPGGILAAYKGRRQSIEEEISSLEARRRENFSMEIFPLEVPFLEEERHLLLIRMPH